jgi:hypothetical protein
VWNNLASGRFLLRRREEPRQSERRSTIDRPTALQCVLLTNDMGSSLRLRLSPHRSVVSQPFHVRRPTSSSAISPRSMMGDRALSAAHRMPFGASDGT